LPLLGKKETGIQWFTNAHPEIDYYFVVSPESRQHLLDCGIPGDRAIVTVSRLRPSIQKELISLRPGAFEGLSAEQPLVLVTGGGLGIGPMAEIPAGMEKAKPQL